jgi:hypothetical protein
LELTRTIGALRTTERLLAEALVLASERHPSDASLREGARRLAGVSATHVIALEPVQDRHGRARPRAPRRLRAALLNDSASGPAGGARDLHDLAVLASSARLGWLAVERGAAALGDDETASLATRLGAESERQVAWLTSALAARAGGALTAAAPVAARVSALPTFQWGPLAAAVAALAGARARRSGRDASPACAGVVMVAGIGAGLRLVARRVRRPLLVRRRLARAREAMLESDQPAV